MLPHQHSTKFHKITHSVSAITNLNRLIKFEVLNLDLLIHWQKISAKVRVPKENGTNVSLPYTDLNM